MIADDQTSANSVCLDTSVLVAFLSPDEHKESVYAVFRKLNRESHLIFGPSLVNFEVLKALRQQEKSGRVRPDDVAEAMRLFSELPIVLVWNKDLTDEALRLDREGIKSVYDAAFLALARLRDIPLITEDKELRKLGRRLHPRVYTTEEWLHAASP